MPSIVRGSFHNEWEYLVPVRSKINKSSSTEEECVVLSESVGSCDRDISFWSSIHLFQNLLGKGFRDSKGQKSSKRIFILVQVGFQASFSDTFGYGIGHLLDVAVPASQLR